MAVVMQYHISWGRWGLRQLGEFSAVVVIVALFVPNMCPNGGGGGGMWGIFGKPLKRAIWNTLGLHAGLTTCLRFSSVSDRACVACCFFLSTGSYHVRIQIHSTGGGKWVQVSHYEPSKKAKKPCTAGLGTVRPLHGTRFG